MVGGLPLGRTFGAGMNSELPPLCVNEYSTFDHFVARPLHYWTAVLLDC